MSLEMSLANLRGTVKGDAMTLKVVVEGEES